MIINVKTSKGQYPIYLERGFLKKVGTVLPQTGRALIVTDSGVPKEYAETVASQLPNAAIHTVPKGESSKCIRIYAELLEALCKDGFARSDCVIAVGGGVVGDLAGFVAATYLRGIAFYNIPTTVLSQVDSSIGGKVAVDFCGYKNNVGAFYPPNAVIIDSDVLNTLPSRQISNGLAEAVKMSLTGDSELFGLFENGNITENIDKIIEKSLLYKKSVVEQDERESGLRRVLNFGHTIGHAIESREGFDGLYHGECVALGMLPMCSKEVRQRLINVLKRLNLPYEIPYKAEELIESMKHDKKMSGREITVVKVEKIGEFVLKTEPFTEFAKEVEML